MNALLIISYYLHKKKYNIQVDDPVYRRFLQETVEAKQKESDEDRDEESNEDRDEDTLGNL